MGKFKNAYRNINALLKKKAQEKRLENAQLREANKRIRQKAREEGLKEREKQAIRVTRYKQKMLADKYIKSLNQKAKVEPKPIMDDWMMRI